MRIKEFTIPPKAVPVEQKVAALQQMLASLKQLNARLPTDIANAKKSIKQ